MVTTFWWLFECVLARCRTIFATARCRADQRLSIAVRVPNEVAR